jgi:hypothetical protein
MVTISRTLIGKKKQVENLDEEVICGEFPVGG